VAGLTAPENLLYLPLKMFSVVVYKAVASKIKNPEKI
jgi:hypothetical protein